jgi:hypothetical protein
MFTYERDLKILGDDLVPNGKQGKCSHQIAPFNNQAANSIYLGNPNRQPPLYLSRQYRCRHFLADISAYFTHLHFPMPTTPLTDPYITITLFPL